MRDASVVDLRSDTVTTPTEEMRAAMAAAEVGDDVYLEDPTVNRLQERAAEIFSKQAALFVPTGTMGNQIAIHLHTSPGQEVVTEARGHIFNYELAAMAAVSGVLARPVPSPDGILSWDMIQSALRLSPSYVAHTGLITLESPHSMIGGMPYSEGQIREICLRAHEISLPVHLDGARIFNAAAALDTRVSDLCRLCDSVMFCLSKGLGAPAGSMLVGTGEFISRARRVRKMLGGGMRQVGILAAAGLIALEKMPSRLPLDHENAKLLAERLSRFGSLDLEYEKVATNIVTVEVSRTGFDGAGLAELLRKKGVLCGAVAKHTLRFVTHYGVSRGQILEAARRFGEVLA